MHLQFTVKITLENNSFLTTKKKINFKTYMKLIDNTYICFNLINNRFRKLYKHKVRHKNKLTFRHHRNLSHFNTIILIKSCVFFFFFWNKIYFILLTYTREKKSWDKKSTIHTFYQLSSWTGEHLTFRCNMKSFSQVLNFEWNRRLLNI